MYCFLFRLHVVSVFGYAELQTAECQESQEWRLTPPSWWDSPSCNPGAVKLEIIEKEVTEVQADESQPSSLLPLDRILSSVLNPMAKNSVYLPVLGCDMFGDSPRGWAASKNQRKNIGCVKYLKPKCFLLCPMFLFSSFFLPPRHYFNRNDI